MWSNISASKLPSSKTIDVIAHNDISESQYDKSVPKGCPLMRYKHAVCSSSNGMVYMYGGRIGNISLDDDIWRFDPRNNTWLHLNTSGPKPHNLQEHTIVEYANKLYLFGGCVSASNYDSLWCLDLQTNDWSSLSKTNSKSIAYLGPTNRRGHSAVVYADCMHVFGGFEDFIGSSSQLWQYEFQTQQWELRNLSMSSACHPEPRHSHSAILFGECMWIYGGLSNLKPLSDLWRWSWLENRWFKEKSRGSSPGKIHGHSAIQAFESMFVFGGERNGKATRGLWRLQFSNMTWYKIKAVGPRPDATIWHGAVANPLDILDDSNFIIERGDSNGSEMVYNRSKGCPSRSRTILSEDIVLSNLISKQIKPDAKILQQKNIAQDKQASMHLKKMSQSESADADLLSRTDAKRSCSRNGFFSRKRRAKKRPRTYIEQSPEKSNSKNDISLVPRHSVSFCEETSKKSIRNQRSDSLVNECGKMSDQNIQKSNNMKILDSLDSDIQRMFDEQESKQIYCNNGVDLINENISSSIATLTEGTKSNSQLDSYRTARADEYMSSSELASHRTSCSYATAASSIRTLTSYQLDMSTATLINNNQDRGTDIDVTLDNKEHGDHKMASKFNCNVRMTRKQNRPKSEIVQSLIDRADDRIKHLYTPYFNHDGVKRSATNATNRVSSLASNFEKRFNADAVNVKHELDKSKRHTIHQTMTYYNLYFSEDKSGNSANDSSPSDETNKKGELPIDDEWDLACIPTNETNDNNQMDCDDDTSSYMKNGCYETGNIIGVHGLSEMSEKDDGKFSSAEANKNLKIFSREDNSSSSSPHSVRRNDNLCSDNTSMSFSAIVEYEEDDILQYTNHSELDRKVIGRTKDSPANSNDEYNCGRIHNTSSSSSSKQSPLDRLTNREKLMTAHKSSSSGYDSMSESHQLIRTEKTQDTNIYVTSIDTPENESLKTNSIEYMASEMYPSNSINSASNIKEDAHEDKITRVQISNTCSTMPSIASDSSECQQFSLNSVSPKRELLEPLSYYLPACQTSYSRSSSLRGKFFKKKRYNRYWQLCMFVIGGKQRGTGATNEPMSVWRLYI